MNKYHYLKKILKISLWTLFSFVILFSIILTLIVWILSPSQLTPLAEKYANQFLDADVKLGKVELTVWKTFPNITVDVDNLEILTHAFDNLPKEERAKLPAYQDTLLTMDKFHGGVNVLKLLVGSIEVNDVMLENPYANIVVYSPTVASYNITKPSSDEPSVMPDIIINSIEISHCNNINYYSAEDLVYTNVSIPASQFIKQEKGKYQFLLDAMVSIKIGEVQALNKFPIYINGNVDWNLKQIMKVGIENWKLKLGNTPIKLTLDADLTKSTKINKFNAVIGEFNFTEIKKYLPKEYLGFASDIETNCRGTLKFELKEPYEMEKSLIPSLEVSLDVPDSYLIGHNGKRLDNFTFAIKANINGKNIDDSRIDLSRFKVKGESLTLNANGSATHFISNPKATGEVQCNVDIAKALEIFDIPFHYTMRGKAHADIKFDIKLGDITKKLFQNIGLTGDLNLRNFTFASKADSIHLYANRANMFIGSKEKFKNEENLTKNIFKATFSIDSLNLMYKGLNLTMLKGVAGMGGIGNLAQLGDNKHYIPIGGEVKAHKINVTDVDSSNVKFTDLSCNISFRQYKPESMKSIANLQIKAARARFNSHTIRAGLNDGDIELQLAPQENRLTITLDSIQKIYPELSEDSILTLLAEKYKDKNIKFNHTRRGEVIELATDKETKGFLRRWDVKGSVKASRGRLITPYFPLRNRMSDLDIKFNLDSFIVNSANLQSGSSSFNLNGGIRNMRSTLLGQFVRPLSINFSLYSDTLDVNQLMTAAFTGVNYAESTNKATFNNSDNIDDSDLQKELDADTTLTAIIIPSNINADINIFAKYAKYADLNLHNMSGALQVNNGAMRLNNFKTESDVGNMVFNALYAARNKKRIRFAFDLGLDSIELKRFIKLIPEVDSILPLLNSMDGIIKADIAATTDIDSTMNVLLPTLTAAVKMHGDSLVLFDSDTFSSIAKMLRFKNKKRNLIDDMTVEFIIKDNKLELFPFVFMMDRYKIGIMGSNDLAMNLKYHISVLKSPIPFKFGLNISGTPENLKYSLGKAKFKEGGMGSVSPAFVETTRINLRDQIEKAFKRGARAAIQSNIKVDHLKAGELDSETLSANDSLQLIKEGLIEAPAQPLTPKQLKEKQRLERKQAKEKAKQEKEAKKKTEKGTAIKREEN